MKKLVLMGQKGFNQFSEVGSELVVDKDGKMLNSGYACWALINGTQLPEVQTIPIGYTNEEMVQYMDAAINGASDSDLAKQFTPFPELKFKNGDFER